MMLSGPSRPLLLLLAIAAAAVLPHVVYPVQAQDAGSTTAKVSTLTELIIFSPRPVRLGT
jgi:hypothetical protein